MLHVWTTWPDTDFSFPCTANGRLSFFIILMQTILPLSFTACNCLDSFFFSYRMIVVSVSVGVYHGFYHIHQADQVDRHACEQTLDYFMGGYLALLFASNIMELSIAWMSGKGSIMDTEPRNLIPQLLYVRLVLSVIELLWLSIGIKWIFLDATTCELTPEIYIARAIVVFNWLFLFSVFIIVYCAFDSAGKHWVRFREAQLTEVSVDASHSITRKYEKRWEGCFKRCCCCSGVGQGDENVFNFIGRCRG